MKKINQNGLIGPLELIVIVLVVGLLGFTVYRLTDDPTDVASQNNEQTAQEETTVDGQSEQSNNQTEGSEVAIQYAHSSGLSLDLPSDWEVLDAMPAKFKTQPDDSGKMIDYDCNGPILQDKSNDDVVIAFEVRSKNSDGDYCWSYGQFDGNKWIPLGDSGWVGDYLVFYTSPIENSDKFAAAVLINYETNELIGLDTFNQIASSASF